MGKMKELKFIDEKIYESEINTLKVYYIPKKGFAKSYAILTSNYGSKDVEFSIDAGNNFKKYPEGIAHFLEHKVFEMPEGGNVFNKFTELGASVNAFTNNHQTSYYFSTTSHFMENLKLLLQMVFTPHLTKENVEKEKGIIAEEIKMYDDHPGFRGYIEAMKALYHEHPVREDIAGSVDSIYSLTPEDLIECYDAFYNPRNMILVVVGDLDIDKVEGLISENVKPGEPTDLVKKVYHEPAESLKKESTLHMNLQVPNYIYGVKVVNTKKDLLKETLIGSLMMKLVFGPTSYFYEENIRNGKINDSFSSEISLDEDHGEIFIGGETKEPEKAFSLIEDYIESIKSDEAFFAKLVVDMDRIKKGMTGNFVNIFNSVDRIGVTTTGMLLHDEDIFSYVEKLKNVTISDIQNKFNEVFHNENSTKVIIQ